MNITLSVDAQTVERARRVAKAMGKSLNQVIREHLEQMAGEADIEAEIAEFDRLTDAGNGNSRGWKFNRDEIYDRKVFRDK
ncbi:MAG: DUF6364 family protein [Alphaproteobacteria bacterium]